MIPRRPASAGRSAEARLAELGIELPAPRRPTTSQVAAVRSGTLLFLSGHGPLRDGRVVYQGRVGQDLTLTEGRAAARLTGLNLLASTRAALGSLDRVRRVVRALGMVQCPADFTDHPKVINGFSDLMVEVFGEAGRHARSAVGAASLPLGMVNSTPEFTDHPKVINGCSDLFVEVFGENGRGARSAVGTNSLPGGIATEIEAIFQVR